MKNSISSNLDIMMQACRKVGPMIRRDFGEIENLQVRTKGLNDFVTSADIKSQQKIVEFLTENKPAFGLIGEEENLDEKKEYNFVIDPIDGTFNFMHGFPYFCVSLGLMEKENYLAGVIYNPVNDELYYAEKGFGAYVDHPYKSKKLRVSKRGNFEGALVSFYGRQALDGRKNLSDSLRAELDSKVGHIRTTGAIALDLVYLASGNLDAVIVDKPKLVDVAAGICLVKEAGGKVEQVDGIFIAAASIELLEKIKECLKK